MHGDDRVSGDVYVYSDAVTAFLMGLNVVSRAKYPTVFGEPKSVTGRGQTERVEDASKTLYKHLVDIADGQATSKSAR